MHSQPLCGTIADLRIGDEVLNLPDAGLTLGRGNGPQHPPVLICEAVPGPDQTIELNTSNGLLNVPAHQHVTYLRENMLRPDVPLLLSRRVSLHAELLSLGIPLIRRSPIPGDESAPEISGREWANAPVVLIDGYLSVATMRAFRERGFQGRENILMIGDDPDDARIYTRAVMLGGLNVAVLPYDIAAVMSLLHTISPNTHLPQVVTHLLANPAPQIADKPIPHP